MRSIWITKTNQLNTWATCTAFVLPFLPFGLLTTRLGTQDRHFQLGIRQQCLPKRYLRPESLGQQLQHQLQQRTSRKSAPLVIPLIESVANPFACSLQATFTLPTLQYDAGALAPHISKGKASGFSFPAAGLTKYAIRDEPRPPRYSDRRRGRA